MGVSVICLLFPLRPEEENLWRRTKGGKNHYSNGVEKRTITPLRSVLNFFLPSLFTTFLPQVPLFLSFSISLPLLFTFFSIERNRRRDGVGGVGSVNVWKMSDENVKQTRRQPTPCLCFDVSETGRRRPVKKVTVIDNFLIVSDFSKRLKLLFWMLQIWIVQNDLL